MMRISKMSLGSANLNKILYRTTVIILCLGTTLGRLTKAPGNIVPNAGSNQMLECCTDSDHSLHWKRKSLETGQIIDIYLGKDGGFVNGFIDSRFSISNSSVSGCFNLIIANIMLDDAGTYSCADEYDAKSSVNAELIVIDTFNCTELNPKDVYIGLNEFGLEPEQIHITCIVNYKGRMAPELLWKWQYWTNKFDNRKAIVKSANSTVTSILSVPAAKEFANNRITCYVQLQKNEDKKNNQVNWTSKIYNINYAQFSRQEVHNCSAKELKLDCNPPCSATQLRYINGSSFCEIAYSRQTHQKQYVSVRSGEFSVPTPNLPTSTEKTSSSETPTWAVVTMSVTITVLVISAAVAVGLAFFCCRKKKRSKQKIRSQSIELDAKASSAQPIMTITLGPVSGNNISNLINISQNQIGNVTSSDNSSTQTENPTIPEKRPLLNGITEPLRQISIIEGTEKSDAGVNGLAVLDDEIFVTRKSSEIAVYDAAETTTVVKRQLKLDSLRCIDITVCPKMKYIFILARKSDGSLIISRINANSGKIGCVEWSTGVYEGLLSSTDESNVLLSARKERKLLEYEPDGEKLQELNLQVLPNHAIKLTSGNYLISHGCDGYSFHGVILIDNQGQILKTFGGKKGSEIGQLNGPMHLIVNVQGDILVADSVNGRIVVLTSDLSFKSMLMTDKNGSETTCPVRLCKDEINNRLFVSDYACRVVRVYDLENV